MDKGKSMNARELAELKAAVLKEEREALLAFIREAQSVEAIKEEIMRRLKA